MRPFEYRRSGDLAGALHMAQSQHADYLAGGTTLIDLMKLDVMRPSTIVDINGLAEDHGKIEHDDRSLRLGALARMSDVADHPVINRDYPVIAQTMKLAATAQLRNMASLGGNVLQRTRCNYFRDVQAGGCNKREPGSGCAALDGVNRKHAVLGTSEHCIATYPGDFAQALIVLDAQVEISGEGGTRTIPMEQFHVLPGDTPQVETTLQYGELITRFIVPAASWTRRSLYVKVRDRQSYEFALASAAVALDMDGDVIRQARIAVGGVATKPWRSRSAEAALAGKRPGWPVFKAAAQEAFADAAPRKGNAFKVALGQRTLIRALRQAATLKV
jgi:xanthine dehydrogenase YagS FAD-binding subunit